MKNFVQPGEVVTLTAPAALSAGNGVFVGGLFGIAACDASSGASVEVALGGVFDMPKASGPAFTEGQRIYWNTASGNFGSTAAGWVNHVGHAVRTAAGADTSARIRLLGIVLP
jgi:predicted RecA/RadA family phage recombinase